MNNYDRTPSKQPTKTTTAARTSNGAATRAKQLDDVAQEQVVVPVIEEELEVGKREVNRGGVRVSSRMVETPVEEQVNLRQEHVHVERHAVDRPVAPRDLDNLVGGTVEFIETDQEAVVAKKARVVEEVVVNKSVTQRTDKIRELLRHTEVEVQSVAATGKPATDARLATFDSDFRKDFASGEYAKSGYAYEHLAPAYQFGYQLGTAEDFKDSDWEAIEPEARAAWDERNPGTWEQVKAAARHAWDKVTGRV